MTISPLQALRSGWADGKARVSEDIHNKHLRKATRRGKVLQTRCTKSELQALLDHGWTIFEVHSEAMSPRYTLFYEA